LGRAETTALLERHGVRLRRSLGQHFLVEPNVVRRIVEIARVGPGSSVLEIGAGAGTLTRALVDSGARVVALEVDQGLFPVLSETVGDTAQVEGVDAASVDFTEVMGDEPWAMVANLPYNVGTPIVLDTLRHVPACERIVVMLQREAVDRLAASPGSREYGIPSVVVALHGSIEVALRVGAHLFVPRPKVESSVAVITRSPAHPAAERAIELAAAAFGQRRKMIRSTLRDLVDSDAFSAVGIAPTARAEELAPADYLRLAELS
jgi:16S rRNA (adenine1518-N6/adenine1519-N6)-dimethyltransferase